MHQAIRIHGDVDKLSICPNTESLGRSVAPGPTFMFLHRPVNLRHRLRTNVVSSTDAAFFNMGCGNSEHVFVIALSPLSAVTNRAEYSASNHYNRPGACASRAVS